jgi:hypothetical protein
MEVNRVSGPGHEQSFYSNGYRYNQELDIFGETRLENCTTMLQMDLRSTDNHLIDSEHFSVRRFSYNVKDSRSDLTVGDYFANFSQYSFNKGIIGAGYQLNLTDDPRNDQNYIRAAFGTLDGQWAYLFEDAFGGEVQNEPMNLYGGGVRVQNAGKDYVIGINSVFVGHDGTDPKRTTETAYLQWVESLDWEYRIKKLKFTGDHAISFTTAKPVANDDTHTQGQAHNIKFQGKALACDWYGKFELVDPDFSTLAGSATPDRIRYYGKVSKRFGKNWKAHVSANYYYDRINRRSELATRTTNRTLEAGIDRYKLFNRKHMKISARYRRNDSKEEGNASNDSLDRIKASLSDKVFGSLKYDLNFETILRTDDATDAYKRDFLYSLKLSTRQQMEKLTLSPMLFLSHRDSDNFTVGGKDIVNTLRFMLEGDYLNSRFGGSMALVGSDISAGVDSLSATWNAFYEIKIKELNDANFKIELKVNDYGFKFDVPEQDYRETHLIMSFNMKI